MACEVEEGDEVIAACALCPNDNCGSLVISYREAAARSSDLWDFVCSRCGFEFSVSQEEILFQFMPLEVLLGKLPHTAHALDN